MKSVSGRRVAILPLILVLLAQAELLAAEGGQELFQGDLRLQKLLTVRVSRTPIGDLLQRMSAALGARLGAKDEEVAAPGQGARCIRR